MSCRTRQPPTHILFVGRMQIVRITYIDGHRQPRVRVLRDRCPLRLAQLSPTRLFRLRRQLPVIRELHDQERQLRAKLTPPVRHQPGEQSLVAARLFRIRFALVPQRPAKRVPPQAERSSRCRAW